MVLLGNRIFGVLRIPGFQMSGQLERLDEIVSMVEMIRVALESKEARK